MALTKPAGCFLQVMGAVAFAGAVLYILPALMPDQEHAYEPSFLMAGFWAVVGFVLLMIGRQPASK